MTISPAATRRYLAIFPLLVVLGLAACATQPAHGRGGYARGEGRGANRGDRPTVVVRPDALFLVGLAKPNAVVITYADLGSAIASLFESADVDKDGKLSPLEFASWAEKYFGTSESTPGWLSFDRDMSGGVTKDEFTAELQELFNHYDTDHDGVITRKQLILRQEVQEPEDRATSGQGDNSGGRRGGRGGRGH